MALDKTKLCAIGNGGANTLHLYTTTDADTVVQASDYFLDAYDMLNVGDFILCNMDTGGTQETKILWVDASSSTTVTTSFPTIS